MQGEVLRSPRPSRIGGDGMTTPLIQVIARAAYTGTHRHCFNGADPHPDDKAWESFKGEAPVIITALTEAGYAIVPVEPTAAMECAMEDAMCASDQCCCDHRAIYRAALGPLNTKEGE